MADGVGAGRVLQRLAVGAGTLLVVWFAVQGGQFGTTDLWRQRQKRAKVEAEIASVKRTVDSLTAVKKSVTGDPKVQERIAREDFGFVRGDKEVLYRIAERSDSTRKRP
jgi:cell division protein FtsB